MADSQPATGAIQRVRLKKKVGKFKAGDVVNVTADQLRAAKLVTGIDFQAIGTAQTALKIHDLPPAKDKVPADNQG